MNLDRLGWDSFFEKSFAEYGNKELIPARILSQQKNNYTVCLENKSFNAKLSGKFIYTASKKKHFPAVGDWTLIKLTENNSQAIIHHVLPRKTAFVRKLPISGGRKVKNGCIVGGTTEEQIIAANVDTVFIVCGLDGNFNLQRIERYITLAYNSGATPVIILNKVDCCESIEDHVVKVRKIAAGLDIYPISVLKNIGMDIFDKYLLQGKTIVFLGSSGVGKSSIINYLIGEEKQRTNLISDFNGKGKHTTTSAQLVFHNSGCMIIDTPGLRELQLWGEEDALNQNFDDIISIAKKCKYRDCQHDKEPGCAVKLSIEEGLISLERLENYRKQHYELVMLDGRIKQNEAYLSKGAKLHAKVQQDKRKGNFQRNKNIFKSF
ncbi:ribosome small subunit-dependent GTPase A [Clostridium sp. BNL1100]|uniref:ribosome small subunit-dependent GTPase A n=1 Tax=Clostridium sp. BNL1100 TaxID=755731 RepID=UPI00024A759C|nr:ribosome small subunit-dependent GTPase A [Clostridium sp. BNL1100]AEY65156.1 ribosome small subunit-dependent GTPase A [Clostridium sp. BNL1100]